MGHRPSPAFNLVSNSNVPKGLAIAVWSDRVLWVGPANVLDMLTTGGWPPGTNLNVSLTDFEIIKTKLPKAEEFPPCTPLSPPS